MKISARALRLALIPSFVFGVAATALRAGDPAAAVPASATVIGRLFDSRDDALQALVQALRTNDDDALKALTGPGSEDIIQDGNDPVVARERKRSATLIAEKVRWEEMDDGSLIAVVGVEEWPMPIPLAPKDGKWYFDVVQGRDELLARRIGNAELRTMDVMRALAQAQEAYKSKDRDGDGVLEYAQKFISTGDNHDGLFWVDEEDVSEEDRSPLGAMVEELSAYLDGKNKGVPFGGYLYKMVTAQGANAIGGEQNYLSGDNLTGGFFVVAVPAEYRVTGVMSFAISHRGRLVEKDVGAKGVELFNAAKEFNPKEPWELVVAK